MKITLYSCRRVVLPFLLWSSTSTSGISASLLLDGAKTTAKTALSYIRGGNTNESRNQQQQRNLGRNDVVRQTQEDCVPIGTQTYDFYISLDANPTDTVYSLVCDNGVTYIRSPTFVASDAYQSFHERACIPTEIEPTMGMTDYMVLTCTLTIADSLERKDGLTAGSGGKFEVYEDGNLINSYVGSNGGPMFEVYTVCCGKNCDNYQPTLPPMIVSDPTPNDDNYLPDDDFHPEFQQCEDLHFTFTLDGKPKQIGYKLLCDNIVIWDVPVGTFDASNQYQTVEEKIICLEKTQTCWMSIFDKKGNGLSSKGSFKLTYGSMVVADYDGDSMAAPENGGGNYNQLAYCFGPDCECTGTDCGKTGGGPPEHMTDFASQPNENNPNPVATDIMASTTTTTAKDADNCNNLIQLSMRFDEFPDELSYTLDCGSDGLVWDKPTGSYSQSQAFGSIEEKACADNLSPTLCCTYAIRDKWGDGITSPGRNMPGWYELKWGGERVAYYDGSKPTAEFYQLTNQIGPGC